MKNISIILLFISLSLPIFAQNVQWAFNVLEVSSQKTNKDFAVAQLLGLPNVMPAGASNTNAWEPKLNEDESFVKVGFLNPIKMRQLIIIESFNPGFIEKITAFDSLGKGYEIANYIPKAIHASSRILQLNINPKDFNFKVFSLKITWKNTTKVNIAIDAIGISDNEKAFKAKVAKNTIVKANMYAFKLSENVNSTYREMGPLVSPDGKTLYFSRRGDPSNLGGVKDEEDIWFSTWDEKNNKWGIGQNMGVPLNNEYPNFINSVSPDGNTILLGNSYFDDGTMEDGVSISHRTGSGWSFPRRMVIEDEGNDKNKSEYANYFQSNSEKILLISNNRKGDSHGERDLYVSFLKLDSTWTKPLNLGKTINTQVTEAAPFLASDNKTLYFSSNGHRGYGGSDIYMSRRLDDTWIHWSQPENLGPIVNTSKDESYLTLTASGNKVYFTSQVKNEQDVDMFRLELPANLKPTPVMLLTGTVYNSKTNEIVPGAKIFFEDLATGIEVGIASSNPVTGNFQIVLPGGYKYGYLAEKQGFISVHSNVDLLDMKEYQEYHKNLFLSPIEVGQKVVINNIFFDFDKFDLKPESFLELNRLAKLLKNNASLKIEISSNADSIGTEAYNDKLSILRATAVCEYFLQKSGVDKNHITLKSYGETNPVASNKTAHGRKLNRRVEFKILAK